MNYAPQILNYLRSSEGIREIYIAPKSVPVEKKEDKFVKIMDVIFTPDDVRDTLIALKSYAYYSGSSLGREGTFSFGLQGIGRFRVSYLTQRGSYLICIVKTPYEIPKLENLLTNVKALQPIEDLVNLRSSGIVVVTGQTPVAVSTFVYSYLQHVAQNYYRIIYIIEKPISFLLRHERSIVVQVEAGVDVETFEEALRNAFLIDPDIVYIGYREFISEKDAKNVLRLVDTDTVVFIHAPYLEKDHFLKEFPYLKKHIKYYVVVEKDKDGMLEVKL
ncbi:ATPase, T2SS/T4P/T4SS family [Thermocrinis minervae]|uniref:Twitching motility protein PilT n=1 Tax=Thermocrinis minervae TaxID=381751 RepID=A0A1M6QX60_9AQUI|nr:ATPase, T2SS/T4P/T4SS family [Thermocrinis minervae]SHK24862.1 twitching motility protein PilT [Thermocrinis minervae]